MRRFQVISRMVKYTLAAGLFMMLFMLIGSCGLFKHYAGLIDYQPVDSDSEILDSIAEDDDIVFGQDSAPEEIDELEARIRANLESGSTELVYHENVFNLLLIGADTRPGQNRGRSDTMIIISINKETEEIVMTSLLRDIYLSIPKAGNNRLNAAYAYGGVSLLIETIESNFGLSIDRYVQVGFKTFTDVIDLMDGVTLELTDAEIEYINKQMVDENQLVDSGNTVRLNGRQTLAYSRIRYLDSDFGRTERQRKVITALLKEARQLSILEADNLLNKILPELTTDLTEGELFSMVLSIPACSGYDVVSFRIPQDGTWSDLTVNGMMVLSIDFEDNRKALIETIYHQN